MAKKQVDLMAAWDLEPDPPAAPLPAPAPETDTPVARAISQGKAAKPKADQWTDDYIEDDDDDELLITKSGKVLTNSDIEALADEAEKGYPIEQIVPAAPKKGKRNMSGEPRPVTWRPTEAEMKTIKPIKPQTTTMHMVKYRMGDLVGVRCGIVYKINTHESTLNQGITAWEKMLTCPNCELAPKTEWESTS